MTFYGRVEDDDRPTHELRRYETVAEWHEDVDQYAAYLNEGDPDGDYERFLENGGVHADQIAWENEQDRMRAPFDPQGGYLADYRGREV